MPVPRRTDVSLVAQLEERSGLYDGLGTVDAERLRSALLARCFEGERTSELLPFCLEQIDAGHDPVAVATAARVLIDLPTALPSDLPARLWRAIIRLRARDRQIAAFEHTGFWQPMDTLRDKNHLEELWASGNAPWKSW